MTLQSQSAAGVRPYISRTPLAMGMIFLFGCAADAVVAVPPDSVSRTVLATGGQEIDVTLGNVGGPTYASPPAISSSAVAFLGVDVIPPYTPAGPTQRFRFRANGAGQAVITFRRILGDSLVSIVEDTVQVR